MPRIQRGRDRMVDQQRDFVLEFRTTVKLERLEQRRAGQARRSVGEQRSDRLIGIQTGRDPRTDVQEAILPRAWRATVELFVLRLVLELEQEAIALVAGDGVRRVVDNGLGRRYRLHTFVVHTQSGRDLGHDE